MNKVPLVLAIETAVREGSISLLHGDRELGHIIGIRDFARSQDLLQMIVELLDAYQINPKTLDLIVVSAGPGSTTGIRIGIATAKALAYGLHCEYTEVSVLEALALKANPERQSNIVSVAPAGRLQVSWQSYARESGYLKLISERKEGTLEAFSQQLMNRSPENYFIIAESELGQDLKRSLEETEANLEVGFASDNVAILVGLLGLAKQDRNSRELADKQGLD